MRRPIPEAVGLVAVDAWREPLQPLRPDDLIPGDRSLDVLKEKMRRAESFIVDEKTITAVQEAVEREQARQALESIAAEPPTQPTTTATDAETVILRSEVARLTSQLHAVRELCRSDDDADAVILAILDVVKEC